MIKRKKSASLSLPSSYFSISPSLHHLSTISVAFLSAVIIFRHTYVYLCLMSSMAFPRPVGLTAVAAASMAD